MSQSNQGSSKTSSRPQEHKECATGGGLLLNAILKEIPLSGTGKQFHTEGIIGKEIVKSIGKLKENSLPAQIITMTMMLLIITW